MRWILVFVILYLIPLTIIFKNYDRFRRALIYSSMYVVLMTTLVISNMYISSVKKLEDELCASSSTNYDEVCVSVFDISDRESDLSKINLFKRDISDIEEVALSSFKQCVGNNKNNTISLQTLLSVEKEIDKALYMCEKVIDAYDNMLIPTMSKEEYNYELSQCVDCMKEAYEIRYEVVKLAEKAIDEKNVSYIVDIKQHMSAADYKIKQYKNRIYRLENTIQGK